jgi:hypothetical protein
MKLLYNIKTDMANDHFACRIMNLAEGSIPTEFPKLYKDVYQQYKIFEYVRVINSNIKSINDFENNWLPHLGFNSKNNFTEGQRASENKHTKYVTDSKLIRRLDYYNGDYYLLPNNEVSYLKHTPENVILYCNKSANRGGRTFIHSVVGIENEIMKQDNGNELLHKYESRGISLEFGYLDMNDPAQAQLYTPSWQEKFNTNNIETALAECMNDTNIDYAFVKQNGKFNILITRTLLPGYIYGENCKYFRPPRIAITEPSINNGFRRFTFGPTKKNKDVLHNYDNYEEFSKDEISIFIRAFLNTRQGVSWKEKDFIIMNNITHCQSKESHDGKLELYVCMSNKINVYDKYINTNLNTITFTDEPPHGIPVKEIKDGCCYWGFNTELSVANNNMWSTHVSMMSFDAKTNLDNKKLYIIKSEAKKYGHIHVYNTGLYDSNNDEFKANVDDLVSRLNFRKATTYPYGGSKSGRTPRTSVTKKTKSVDKYPSELFLLPHNEILYQHALPIQLFFSALIPSKHGGRTFSHSSILFEKVLRSTSYGEKLFNTVMKNGFTIKTGFVSKYEPEKHKNFLVAWEDRFGVPANKRKEELNSIVEGFNKMTNKKYTLEQYVNEKLIKYSEIFPVYFQNVSEKEKMFRIESMLLAKHALCWRTIDKFDRCEWRKNQDTGYPYLYTKINIASYKTDLYNENIRYLLFPRIQYTDPDFVNGYRDFTIGEYTLTPNDIDLLLKAYWLTREGLFYKPGDFQLINNIQYSHSREGYEDHPQDDKKRKIVVAMGGTFFTDKLLQNYQDYITKISHNYPKKDIYNEPTIYEPRKTSKKQNNQNVTRKISKKKH